MTNSETTIEARELAEEQDGEPRAWVALVEGEGPAVVMLPRGATVSIGRSHSSAFPIEDRAVSRLHATLRWDGDDRVELTDCGSRNGTFVAGQRLEGSIELPAGTDFCVGSARMVVAIQRPADDRVDASGGLPAGIVARDPAMLRVVALAERAAGAEVTVLIQGETGVGKEVVARMIHGQSARSAGDFVALNCGAIAETLAESTLFGHERGAFTGAASRQVGFFEKADGGTLFLDEVGELSPAMQVRLLRALEERSIVRVGATEPIALDVRVVAATNADLGEKVADGAFREDLLYRLDVLRIEIPPLRQRPEDVVVLAEHFLRELAPGVHVRLSSSALELLRSHHWPGNVRELRNAIERALAVRNRDVLGTDDFSGVGSGRQSGSGVLRHQLDEVERDAIAEALEACDGNQTRAAKRLGLSRRGLIYKLEKYGLKPPPRKR